MQIYNLYEVKNMFAMYEKDYIMRLVKEMVRTLLKLLFNIDTTLSMDVVIKRAEEQVILQRLLSMIDEGDICEAENELYEITADGDRMYLKTALIFYYRLAEKGDEFLKEHNFSINEVKEGVEALAERYNISDLSSVFLR